jgi:hypothetical protein
MEIWRDEKMGIDWVWGTSPILTRLTIQLRQVCTEDNMPYQGPYAFNSSITPRLRSALILKTMKEHLYGKKLVIILQWCHSMAVS